jgi:glucuronoarabinoxylan endo-1,4-beta-xylanase
MNMKNCLFKLFASGLASLAVISLVQAQSVTIEMDSTRQLIRGFGGIHINAWQGTQLNADLQEKAFDNDPGEIGLSILRLQISPDSNHFGNELDIAQYAVSKGAIVFGSPWDAPPDMLDPEAEQDKVLYERYGDYADHLNRFNQYMADNGVPIYAVSVQNEPDISDWTRWTEEEMATFLAENGQDIETRVIAPESFQFNRDYTDFILNDSAARANVDIVGGHIYGGGLADYPLARELGKEVWMTEHLTGSESQEINTWELALALGTEINLCMKANFNVYVWWYIRRFYGLITDDGNISKKGYVMSQFSKFIRPGAIRVDATPESASGIAATAFKTDTTLVVVVINTSASAVTLDFDINNNTGIDTLIQFTTSRTKNVMNDGGISVAGDSLTATVDALSITTFTSWAGNGGKFGNIPPVAVAGPDTVIVDTLGIGIYEILLDASASTDTDGEIVNFTWSLNDRQISWDTTCLAQFGVGNHTVILAVTDDDGARDIDTMFIEVVTTFETEIWLETECAIVGSSWEIHENTNASHGLFVNTPAGYQKIDAASEDTADHLIFNFHISESGPYKVWGRVIDPTADDDSYWVKMDDDPVWVGWNNIVGGANWHWDDVHNWSNEEPVIWQLDTGMHVLSICMREDGTLLDKIYITNTGNTPEGIGGADTTCTPIVEVAVDGIIAESQDVRLFPNPSADELHIQIRDLPVRGIRIEIIDIRGQQIMEDVIRNKNYIMDISALKEGIYIVVLRDRDSVRNLRFVKAY